LVENIKFSPFFVRHQPDENIPGPFGHDVKREHKTSIDSVISVVRTWALDK
jgi:hypothetical protein